MRNGRIPERMTAYLRPEQEKLGDGQGAQWWSFPPDRRETPGFSKYKACPAFVVPTDSENFNKSGMDWACGGRGYVQIQKPKDVVKVEFENKPFTGLRWVGMDSRCEGGIAYKVVTPEGWLVDLREDVVIDCLYEGAINSQKGAIGNGTYFTGEFVWAILGSQSRLVRVGSKDYQEIVESQDRSALEDIPNAQLELGGVYENRQGKQFVLIARGTEKGKKILTQQLHRYVWYNTQKEQATEQELVNGAIAVLGKPNCIPDWHWFGSLKVVKKLGQVSVPLGLEERFEKKCKELRRGNW